MKLLRNVFICKDTYFLLFRTPPVVHAMALPMSDRVFPLTKYNFNALSHTRIVALSV